MWLKRASHAYHKIMSTSSSLSSKQRIDRAGKILNDEECSLAERFRALFTLRNIGGSCSIDQISKCLTAPNGSALLKHECAYCLGQMNDDISLPVLRNVLSDITQNSMVRHEAGEALAAIGKTDVIELLQQYTSDPYQEVAETCQIAIDKLKWLIENDEHLIDNNPYCSIDPAPPTNNGDLIKWAGDLINPNLSLFTRYRAMFAIRNIGGVDAVQALVKGLTDSSTLFKHEIAYVLGQMKEPSSVNGLHEKLQNTMEHAMVRHECAEALGSIASEECLKILHQYVNDQERVVRESCIVALDMYSYEHSEEFQYANI